ncbi:translocation/assembly module TamB [bacterium]|nr:translocation/assembly module TamB [bacterium]
MQTKIIKSITQDFKFKTKQEFSIQKVSLKWNGKLQLSDFYIEDHHGDTLLYAKEFKTSILDFKKLSDSDLDLFTIEASQVYFNLKKYVNEETHSLKILIDKLKKDTPQKNKFLLKSSSVEISKGHFVYNDLSKDSSLTTNLSNIELLGTDLIYKEEHIDVALESLNGFLISPKELPVSLKGIMHYEPGILAIDSLELESDLNRFKGALTLTGKDNTLKNVFTSGSVKLVISEGSLHVGDFLEKPSYFKNTDTFAISLTAEGPLNELKFKNVKIANEAVSFDGSLDVQHLLDPEKPNFLLDIESMEILTASFAEHIPNLEKNNNRYLELLEKIQFSGSISSTTKGLKLALLSTNGWGDFSLSGGIGMGFLENQDKNRSFDLSVNLQDVSLGKFLTNESEYKLSSELYFKGNVPLSDPMSINWKATNTSLTSSKLALRNISFEGRFQDKILRNTLSINSLPVELKSDALFNFSEEVPLLTLVANISKLDLNSFGLKIGADKKDFSGVVISNVKGINWDDIVGELKISSASITNDSKKVFLNPISIKKQFFEDETQLSITNSDCISGSAKGIFKLSELGVLFRNALHQVYPFLPQTIPSEGQYLGFNMKIYKKLLDAIYPSLSISENIFLKGRLASDGMRSEVTLDAPILRWDDIQFKNIHFQLDTKNPLYNTFLSVGDLKHEYYSGKEFNMISTQLRDTLYFRSEFLGNNNGPIPFEVNFYHTKEVNGTSHFGIKKSELPLGSDSWTVNPSDSANEKISYSPSTKTIQVSEFNAISGAQTISLSGSHKTLNDFKFNIDAKNVLLENILPDNPIFSVKGKASVSGSIERSLLNNKLDFLGEIKGLTINQEELGEFKIQSNGNTKKNIFYTNLNIEKNKKNTLSVVGVWQDLENPMLNYDLNVNDLDLSFLSPLGKTALNEIKGILSGSVNVWGPLENLKHNGLLSVNDGGLKIPYLNVEYAFKQTDIRLYDQVFEFKDIKMNDTALETTAVLDGTFSHTNFRDWTTNLRVASDRMLLLNTEQNPESLFFGQGFLEGEVLLVGPTKNLMISVEGKTDNGTSIKIPWAEDYGLTDTSYISFIDKNNKNRFTVAKTATEIQEISGLELNFELDLTNEAEIEIVIDQETGSYLNGKGAGNLFMEINTNGKFNMWGDFITYEGIYNFKNLGVIDKKFNVKPGGTIVWEGNPLEAQMDLEAVYDVPGGANPALLLDNPNFNKKIQTEVLIRLQGNLLKPDNPVFEIDFPNTSGTVASEINYRLSDPQRSQLQAISLLSQGIFINEVSVSMQGITNNLYQKASDIFSDLIGEENDKLKVGIDYLQGDKSALLDIATEDRLGFTLSTKISDRILLNGKIGVPVGGLEQTLIVGNVQIDFILNEEGSLRAKVFNKENEFRYIGDELGYTQGVGLSYNVDFDTFKELIKKISTLNPGLSDEKISKSETSLETDLIQFVNKN